MSRPLDAAIDFPAFFKAVNGHVPFPWQTRLACHLVAGGTWPDLALPTGAGKTAALDIAVFHLAAEAHLGAERRAPVRVAFVVDRRLVVDDAFARARRLSDALRWALLPPDSAAPENADDAALFHRARGEDAVRRVALALAALAGAGAPPLLARRLRGGVPREEDWARTPHQPTLLSSTIDQVGSRLLFRGYGISDRMKPVQAGLLGSDCLFLLDEAHLAAPFRETLQQVACYQKPAWRAPDVPGTPFAFASLSATPGKTSPDAPLWRLDADDHTDAVLHRRMTAKKPVHLHLVTGQKDEDTDEDAARAGEEASRVARLVKAAVDILKNLKGEVPQPAIAVVVNRVARARAVFEALGARLRETSDVGPADLELMIGPARPVEREGLSDRLAPIRTGAQRVLEKPLVIVATQTIEAGVDIDLHGMVSDLAPLDALRQRFGRLNRDGRLTAAPGAIVAAKGDFGARTEDPVYGRTLKPAWEWLDGATEVDETGRFVDFGIEKFDNKAKTNPIPAAALAPTSSAPVLMPAHVDLLAQTAPIPAADPEVALWLHGMDVRPPGVTVIWRADLPDADTGRDARPDAGSDARARRLLLLVPPRAAEAIELPIAAVRRWLKGEPMRGFAAVVADVPLVDHEDEAAAEAPQGRPVFLWRGDDDTSRWIAPRALKPGDTIVVPAVYGGLDAYGWRPQGEESVADVADVAARPQAERRFAVRLAGPLLVAPAPVPDKETRAEAEGRRAEDRARATAAGARLAAALAGAPRLRQGELDATLGPLLREAPPEARAGLVALDKAARGPIERYPDLYGTAQNGGPLGLLLVAPRGLDRARLADYVERERKRPSDPASATDAPLPAPVVAALEELLAAMPSRAAAHLPPAEGDDALPATEDDAAGSLSRWPVPLEDHCKAVSCQAKVFARACALPDALAEDLALAGLLHDLGKADPRFQARLAPGGDPFGADAERLLAKSARGMPRADEPSLLPKRWRHEALSVRMALLHPRIEDAHDPDLVLWLVGTHHGHGRPFFPFAEDEEAPARLPAVIEVPIRLTEAPGPEALAFVHDSVDWPGLFARLTRRYGPWGLARLEAILRLADHRASAAAEACRAPGKEA